MSSGKEDNNNTDNNTKSEPTNLDQSVDEIHEIHDIDDIPTLDDLVDIDHLQEIENQKWEELPPLKELDSKSHHATKKSRNDGIDMSVLTKYLVHQSDNIMEEDDEIWTTDFLMSEVTKYFIAKK
mmetsp:Transcript_6592/g.10006  ORF Transcript_6592/g.10006 Transcript_6592/m.10006 type:complete len:125 (-) Transcript_6592:343-717(-)